MIEILDPTWGDSPDPFVCADALTTVEAATIGVVSNGKAGTRAFFDALADELVTNFGVGAVPILVKDNYSAPAGDDIMDRTAEWNALISGIGD